jgi:Tol biopolymer transport system component
MLLTLAGAASLVAQSRSLEVQFKAAEQKELVQGDLKGAIADYERIARGSNRTLAAQALLRIAAIHAKVGDADARKMYERVVREFADQTDAASVARARLANGAERSPGGVVCSDCASVDTTMSADGRLIAFMDARSRAISVRDLTTGQTRRLSTKQLWGTPAPSIMSLMSRDGRQVAYLDLEDSPRRLQVIEIETGAKPRTVIDRPAKPLAWSSDGKMVLCLIPPDARIPTAQFGWLSVADGSLREIKTEADLRGLQRVAAQVALSPDGQYFAYVREMNAGTSFIHVIGPDGFDNRVVGTVGRNWGPVWAGTGKHLLFLSNRSGKNGLWAIAVNGGRTAGNATEVVSDLGDGAITSLGMTSTGTYRYVFEQDGVERITIVSVDRGGKRVPGAEEHMLGTRPLWSPDGKYLAFTRRQPGFDRGTRRGAPHFVVIRDMVAGAERTFPTPVGEMAPSGWFSDSKGILARVRRNGDFVDAYRMNVETGELTRLFEGQLSDPNSPIMLSRDDRTLYVFRGGIVAKDIATGKEAQVLSAAQGRLVPALSPDGTMWAISRRDAAARRRFFGVTDVNGGNLRELYSPEFDMLFEHVDWTPDSRSILFHQSREVDRSKPLPRSTFFPNDVWPRQVVRLSVEGGAPEFTGIEADGWMLGTLAISPDGKRGAYSYVKPVSELRALKIGTLP